MNPSNIQTFAVLTDQAYPARKKMQQLLTRRKVSIDALLNEMQPLVFERGRFVFQEKPEPFHILALSVQKVCDERRVSWKFILERYSQAKGSMIDTLIEDIESVDQDVSRN